MSCVSLLGWVSDSDSDSDSGSGSAFVIVIVIDFDCQVINIRSMHIVSLFICIYFD